MSPGCFPLPHLGRAAREGLQFEVIVVSSHHGQHTLTGIHHGKHTEHIMESTPHTLYLRRAVREGLQLEVVMISSALRDAERVAEVRELHLPCHNH